MTAERIHPPQPRSQGLRASMEPRSDDRGEPRARKLTRTVLRASMEPRSDDRGEAWSASLAARVVSASMEPRSDDRGELGTGGKHGSVRSCFNGAAVG